MSSALSYPQCQTPLADAREGLFPACLLAAAMASSETIEDTSRDQQTEQASEANAGQSPEFV